MNLISEFASGDSLLKDTSEWSRVTYFILLPYWHINRNYQKINSLRLTSLNPRDNRLSYFDLLYVTSRGYKFIKTNHCFENPWTTHYFYNNIFKKRSYKFFFIFVYLHILLLIEALKMLFQYMFIFLYEKMFYKLHKYYISFWNKM